MSRAKMRLEARMARVLAEIIHDMKDPRLPLIVSVERVRLSGDLSRGRVLISALERSEETVELLNRAHGHIQEALAHQMAMRRVPRLSFHFRQEEVL